MIIVKAEIQHLNDLLPLFDGYRVFYKRTSNIEGAKKWLKERLEKQDTIIYIAYTEDIAVGFMQLFHSFTSISMKPLYILNDLYVAKNYRKQGFGVALLNQAKRKAKEDCYKFVVLQTEKDNPAQHLYEGLNWKQDKDLHYIWENESL
ncbi:GNAT family N-acetyltransferase [Lacinutrix chionoecetis]